MMECRQFERELKVWLNNTLIAQSESIEAAAASSEPFGEMVPANLAEHAAACVDCRAKLENARSFLIGLGGAPHVPADLSRKVMDRLPSRIGQVRGQGKQSLATHNQCNTA